MSYQVLARKWRPKKFVDVVGQEHVLSSLTHALNAQRVHHAYLFTGTRGVGKTTIARILAKSLSCERGVSDDPCGECGACRAIDEGRFVDLIEIDAASRTKVEDTRELLDNVQYAPSQGRYKIYLIDEVHMLSTHSFNALLKTLEEPPEHVKFLLATTDPQKLPVTVLSRCLQYHLRHLSVQEISQHLGSVLAQEQVIFEQPALVELAQAAQGSVRDALSLLDQAISGGQGAVDCASVHKMLGTLDREHTAAILQAVVEQDQEKMASLIVQLRDFGVSGEQVLLSLGVMLYHVALHQSLPAALPDDIDTLSVASLSSQLTPLQVQVLYQVAAQCRQELPIAPDAMIGLEMALLRLMHFRPMTITQHKPSPAMAKVPQSFESRSQPSQPRPQVIKANKAALPTVEVHAPPGDANWLGMVEKLGLKGIANQLAQHCSLISQEGERIVLCVDHKHAPMVHERVRQTIEAALQQHYGHAVHLSIETGEHAQATPATEKAVQKQEERAGLEASLENDPNVQFMQAQFGAIIEPNSVKPNNSN